MSLFDVPGWSIPTPAPVREDSHSISKKRKRPANNSDKIKAVEVSLEKIMATLNDTLPDSRRMDGTGSTSTGSKHPQGQLKSKKRKQKHDAAPIEAEEHGKHVPPVKKAKLEPKSAIPSNKSKQHAPNDAPAGKTKKKTKTSNSVDAPVAKVKISASNAKPSTGASLTSLQQSMKEKLDGARFRSVTEIFFFLPDVIILNIFTAGSLTRISTNPTVNPLTR